ncbi:uncharacterized protein SPPG_02950 [Spizellomyces punctatus DAOM BR117]|uniref:FHA domain-containing protein n=1 Tax=Spizellomyces punctatus (strain DAOM BR117) TaxID=645134 RepID=A0A0L0HNG3_SPIPD|nr:uncharacterized protein SPPG_02950 [Spizellomyces punctatus DAOM BR117]KND02490.1 hypothetical protein SPPG_02950 [Spizellomyces punctatus DAOM BR117]|eukprot:XP_016610529.1 hypothetical protein SPPG_02950 [Spizellomyces punctatus DAOM BR117]
MESSHAEDVDYGRVVAIRKTGEDAGFMRITQSDFTIGRDLSCDIKIRLLTVSRVHAVLQVDKKTRRVTVTCRSPQGLLVNKETIALQRKVLLKNGDVIDIQGRRFRFENSTGVPSTGFAHDSRQTNNALSGSPLHIFPAEELEFQRPCASVATKSLSVTNTLSDASIYINVKTNAPDRYRISPATGSIAPGDTLNILISLHIHEGPTESDVSMDNVTVKGIKVPADCVDLGGEDLAGKLQDLLQRAQELGESSSKAQSDSLLERTLKCVYVDRATDVNVAGTSGTPSEAKAQVGRKETANGELMASKSIATAADDPAPRRIDRSRARKTLSASSLPTLIKTGAARSVRPATKSTLQNTSTSTDGSFWQQMDKVLTATNQPVKPPQATGKTNTPNSRRQGVAAGAKSVPAKEQRRGAAGVTAPRRASTLFGYAVHPSLKDLSLADSEPTLRSITNAKPTDHPIPPENKSCDDKRKSPPSSPSHTGDEREPADSDTSLSTKATTSDSTPKRLPSTKPPSPLPKAVDTVEHATSPTAKVLTQSPTSTGDTPPRKSPEDVPEDQPSTSPFVPISNPLIVLEGQAAEENLQDAKREESDNVSLLNANLSPDEVIPDGTLAQETPATDRIQEIEVDDDDKNPSCSQETDEHANQADEGSAALTPPVSDLLTPGRSLSSKSKKGVTFGPPLSPEVFDETLPINSPVVRGRQVLLSREVGKRSILKSQEHLRREAEEALRVASELAQTSESEPVLQDPGKHGNTRETGNAGEAEEDKNSDIENGDVDTLAFQSIPSISEIVENDGGDGKVPVTSDAIESTKQRDGENGEFGVAQIETEPSAGAAHVAATVSESRKSSRRKKSTDRIKPDDVQEGSETLAVEAQPPPSSPAESAEEPSDNKRRGRKRGSAKTAKPKTELSGTEGSALDIITEQGAPSMPTDAIELPKPEKGDRLPAVVTITEDEQSSKTEISVADVTDGVESTTEDQIEFEKSGILVTDENISSRAETETPATEDPTAESAADVQPGPLTIEGTPKVKRRGRPPKVTKSTQIDVTETPATKDATIESPKPVDTPAVGEKGRGSKRSHPPKVVNDTEEDTSAGAVPDDVIVKTADIIGTAGLGDNAQVRKRGRPPKVTRNTTEDINSASKDTIAEVRIEATDASTNDEKTPVRRRGRPPKVAKNTTEDMNSPAEAPAIKAATAEAPESLSKSTLNDKTQVRKRGRPRKAATDMKEDTCTGAETRTEDVTDPSVNSPQPHAETADEQREVEGRGRTDSPQATTLGPQAAQEETAAAESSTTDSVLSASVETRSEPPQPRKSRRGAARARKEETTDVHSVDAVLKDQARSTEVVVEQEGDDETKGEAKGNANIETEQNMSVETANAMVQELEVKDATDQVIEQPKVGRRGRRRSMNKGKQGSSHTDTGTTRVPVTDEQPTVPTSTETVAEHAEDTDRKAANAKSKELAKEANLEPVVEIPSVEDSAEQPVDAQGIGKRRRGRAAAKAQKNRETSNDADLEHASIECEDHETTPADPTDSQPAPKAKSRGRAVAKKSEDVKKEEARKEDVEALSLESGESAPPSTTAEVVQQDTEVEGKVRGMRNAKARQPKQQEAVEAEAADGLQQSTVESVPSGSTTEDHQPVAVRRKRGRAASKAKTLMEESAAVENSTPVDTHATDVTIEPVPPSIVPEAEEKPSDASVKVRTRAGGKRTKTKEGKSEDKTIPNVDDAPEFVEAQAPSTPSEMTKKLRGRPAAKTKAAVEDFGENNPSEDVAAEEPMPIPTPADVEPERARRGRRRAAATENKAASEQEKDLKENPSTQADTETQPEVEVKGKGRAVTRARKAMEERTDENALAEAEPIDQPSIEQTSRKGGLRRAAAKTKTDNKQVAEADTKEAPVDDVPDGKRTTKGVTSRAKQQTRASTKENHDPKADTESNADSKPISIPTESFYGAAEEKKVTRATAARRKKAAK